MNDPFPRVGIVFNAYEPRPINTGERLSEESVAEMANQVHGAVKTLGYDPTLIPLQRSLVNFIGRVRELNLDVLVNLCEGFFGRPQWESNIAAVFELLGMSFTGSDSKTLALCQDKYRAKAVLSACGLPTAPSQLVTEPGQAPEIRLPAIIKPNSEDASLGITPDSVVRDAEAFDVQTRLVLEKYNQPALAEEFIDGREFNVAVYENAKPEALPVSELDFSAMPGSTPHILSYAAKWFEDHALYTASPPVCPAPIDDDASDEAPGDGRRRLPGPRLPGLRPRRFPDGREGAHLHPGGQSQSGHQPQRRVRPGHQGRGPVLRGFLEDHARERSEKEGVP